MTQSRLGELLGDYDFATVSRWERGVFNFPEEKLDLLVKILGKPREYFLGTSAPLPPTLDELLATVRRQEIRIRELEAQLAAGSRRQEGKGALVEAPRAIPQDLAKELLAGPVSEDLEQSLIRQVRAWRQQVEASRSSPPAPSAPQRKPRK
jgi:transcriptional regulator with XRE-family HTH domain